MQECCLQILSFSDFLLVRDLKVWGEGKESQQRLLTVLLRCTEFIAFVLRVSSCKEHSQDHVVSLGGQTLLYAHAALSFECTMYKEKHTYLQGVRSKQLSISSLASLPLPLLTPHSPVPLRDGRASAGRLDPSVITEGCLALEGVSHPIDRIRALTHYRLCFWIHLLLLLLLWL